MVGDCVVGKMTWREGDWERDGSMMGLGSTMELGLTMELGSTVRWRTRLVGVR